MAKTVTLWSDGQDVYYAIESEAPLETVNKRTAFRSGGYIWAGFVLDTLCPCCKRTSGTLRYRCGSRDDGFQGIKPGRTEAAYEVEDLGGI